RLLGAPVLVVVRAGLGTQNETALTCEALRARGVACAGLVVGAWPAEPDLAARCNLEDLEDYAGAPVVGRLPAGAGGLDRARLLAAAKETIELEVPA
ncbi:MAG TPA: AAA family ATPase, partial [Solirubrobacteraceae bacterium]|nr:AAA family ATPase [Solirubrobacteraceae bacterium]